MKTSKEWRDEWDGHDVDLFIKAVQADARDSALEDAATCLQPYEAASIRALKGNSIVPQIAQIIGQAIMEYENDAA